MRFNLIDLFTELKVGQKVQFENDYGYFELKRIKKMIIEEEKDFMHKEKKV